MDNKVAIVTGTSSGLGLASAQLLLERGFTVYGGSRSESSLSHENFIEFELDITQENSLRHFFNEIQRETEVIDLLINAAGVCELSSFEETTVLDMRSHLETNVMGTFNLLKRFEPFILAEETHIVNLYSISAKNSYPNTSAYTSAEHAKKGLIDVIEKEWKKYQIRFSNFYIGAVNTPLWEEYEEIEFDKMLSIEDFQYVLDSVISAPESIQFPDITFLHRDGFVN